MRPFLFTLSLLFLSASGRLAVADSAKPTFDQDVVGIFKQHCTNCHGNDKQKSDLNLASFAALQKGGSSGAVVVPGNLDKSRLYSLTAHLEEPKMPPKGDKIPLAQLNTLKLWIEQGARENSGSKAIVPAKTLDISLKSVVKGRPAGPPPMPANGKLKLDPVVRARRAGAVLALATSPWAPLAAIGGQHQVILYNTDTAQIAGILPFTHGQINSIKFSRNAQFLLVAGGRGGQSGKAVLYKVENGEKVIEVGIESDAILAADISADQTQIAVGSPSKLIRIYSTTDGKVIREIKKHTDWITAVEFSPDGVLLATGDRNGGLFVWESFTGREYFSLRGHTKMITDVSWRDDSNVLASSSEDTTIKLWEMENGRNIRNWGAHGGGTASVRFTHDGKLASTGRDRVTKLWNQAGAAQKTFEAFPDLGLQVAVTHDNAKVIAGDWSGMVKQWNATDAKVVAILDTNPPPVVERVKNAEAAIGVSEAKIKAAQGAFNAAALRAKQAGDAHTAAVAKLNSVKATLAAATKAIAVNTAAAKAAKPMVDAAKAEVAKLTPAAKVAGNKAAAAALKAATDKQTAAAAKYAAAMANLAAAQKTVAAFTPMVKPATDAIIPAKKAADAAAKAVAPAKAALAAANAEAVAAKSALGQLKAALASPRK